MKYVTKYKSPNYNSRKNARIKLIVIHYTALKNTQTAIAYLCNKKNKVSAHYLISQDGKVYLLVNERYRAWHAGLSYWNNFKDINLISIGIELDYSPNNKNNKFYQKMISSLIKILFKIQNKYKISKKNDIPESPDTLYVLAKKSFDNKEYEIAENQFTEIIKIYPLSNEAIQSEIMIGFISYIKMDYDSAILNFKKIINKYPSHKDLDYVYYMLAMCNYEQLQNASLDGAFNEIALKSFS